MIVARPAVNGSVSPSLPKPVRGRIPLSPPRAEESTAETRKQEKVAARVHDYGNSQTIRSLESLTSWGLKLIPLMHPVERV